MQPNRFSEGLKTLRISRNLSQQGLAKLVQVSRQQVVGWENGFNLPSCKSLIRLADLFGISIDALVGRDSQ